jgi:hypothetical protein
MDLTETVYNSLTEKIIKCCIDVHKELGPGLMESVYEVCLISVLVENGFKVQSQVELPVNFKGKQLNKKFVIDLLIEDENKKLGLLINFNVVLLKDGIRRRINGKLN